MAASSSVLLLLGECFLLFLVLLPSIQSKPVKDSFGFIKDLQGSQKGQTVKGLQDIKLYLRKFGYLNYDNQQNHANDDEFDDLLESAIKTYQRRHGLKPTGSLDAGTVNQMKKPRCGFPDNISNQYHGNKSIHFHTVRRYNLPPGNPKWPTTLQHLRYRFVTSINQDWKPVIARAFQRWAEVSRFSFVEAPGESKTYEIEIGFHDSKGLFAGDTPFDGPRGVLAHATLPTDGRFHFDIAEGWRINPGPDHLDLESVAVHEIGHLLGLAHSDVSDAVMFAYFDYGTKTKRDLHPDDIEGITALYGPIRRSQ